MQHFPSVMTERETAKMIARIEQGFEENGFGLWALEHLSAGTFLGFTGLVAPNFEAHFTPAVEVGWRLAREHWGNGYASEAAKEALRFGFDEIGLEEIVSFAIPANTRSIRVMESIGMTHDPGGDFDHPNVTDERLRRHVLYRMPKELWIELNR